MSDIINIISNETKTEEKKEEYKQPTGKQGHTKVLRPASASDGIRGRKKKVVPEVIVVDKPAEETISYSKAEKMTRVKRGMSDKQRENVLRLIQLNKERREAKADEEKKAKDLDEAKSKQKVLRVLPKRPRKAKTESKKTQREEESESDSDDDKVPVEMPSESEGTKKINKKIQKLQTITKALDSLPKPQPQNPYLNILKNSGF
jgi:hypothetical protein